MKLATIVEGHGDEAAVPVLLRRWIAKEGLTGTVTVLRPHRIPRGHFAKEAEVRRRMRLIAKETQPGDAVLALFDADEDCAADLGRRVVAWMRAERPDRTCAAVLAVTEFEAWYLAAALSLVACGKLANDTPSYDDPESLRDAKGRLSSALGRRYSETLDQPSLASLFDFAQARTCGSFRKLERDLFRMLKTDHES